MKIIPAVLTDFRSVVCLLVAAVALSLIPAGASAHERSSDHDNAPAPHQAEEFTVRLLIERINETECVDDGLFRCGSGADFYAVITMLDETFDNEDTPESERWSDTDDIRPNWEFSKRVSSELPTIPVTIEIRDEDGGFRGGDDHVDIKPGRGRGVRLSVAVSGTGVVTRRNWCLRHDH